MVRASLQSPRARSADLPTERPHFGAYGRVVIRDPRLQERLGLYRRWDCRDSAFIEKLGFPVFCGYYTPLDIVGKWAATAFEHPITIGDVTIHSGDYVLADRDGIVIIPQALVEEVTVEAEEVLRKENLVRKAILQGVDPVAAYLQYGKF